MEENTQIAGAEAPVKEETVAASVQTEAAPAEKPVDQVEGSETQADEASERKRPTGSQRSKAKIAELTAEIERYKALVEANGEAKAPKLEQFENWDEFQDARDRHIAETAVQKALEVENKRKLAEAEAARKTAFEAVYAEKADAWRKAAPDFDTVLQSAVNLPVAQHVGAAIVGSDDVPALQYYLAKNPSVLTELNALPPDQVARRLGRIEAGLSLPTTPKQSSAPPPVGSVKGGSAPFKNNPAEMSFQEFKKFREAGGKIG